MSTNNQWSRSGARNIAGVTYQELVTVRLLVAEISVMDASIVSVTPEGDEDIDCVLSDGTRLLVQAKERKAGAGKMGLADIVGVIEHAASVLNDDSSAHFALVTDAQLGSNIEFTGWDSLLVDSLTIGQIDKFLKQAKILDSESMKSLLARTHIVYLPWQLEIETVSALCDRFDLHRALAELVHAKLFEDIAQVASEQRLRSKEAAISRTFSDVEAIAHKVLSVTDTTQLDEAVRAGIVEPIDFLEPDAMPPEHFLAGVDVHPGHIAAGLDIARPQELSAIYEALKVDRYALILGPSGAGKSALLWRSAREAAGLVRLARIRRLMQDDVPKLIQWVKLQAPSVHAPLLICADDLGRPHMSGWENVVDLLHEYRGVMLLGAVRQEDFDLSLTRSGAQIIEPKLDEDLAYQIADNLTERNITTHLDAAEAFEHAGGLLMEYLYLLLTGRRLDDVLTDQVNARMAPELKTERELLRYICAAQTVGLSLDAEVLPKIIASTDDLTGSLARLCQELLITTDSQERWTGLHELRSGVVTRRLHELPPPTKATTFAELLRHVDTPARCHLIRRYAMQPEPNFVPIIDVVSELVNSDILNVCEVADLLEALAEADATRYAKSCIDIAQEFVEVPVNLFSKVFIAYGIKFISSEIAKTAPAMKGLAGQLPERPEPYKNRVIQSIPEDRIVVLATDGSLTHVARLLSALESEVTIAKSSIESIWLQHHQENIQDRCQLVTSLNKLGKLSKEELTTHFDPAKIRLHQLISDCLNGVSAVLESGDDRGNVAVLQLMAPVDGMDAHEQAMRYVDLTLDLLPEIDLVEVITIDADGERHQYNGVEPAYKQLSQKAVHRTENVQENSNFLDSTRRLLAHQYWTERLRQQVQLCQELEELLAEVPVRILNSNDNPKRRTKWVQRVSKLREQVSSLMPPPHPDLDKNTPDHAEKALKQVTTALNELGARLGTSESQRWTVLGAQLRDALVQLREARDTGLPKLSQIGDPLPQSLDLTIERNAELFLALAEYESMPRVSHGRGEPWVDTAEAFIESTRSMVQQNEIEAFQQLFDELDAQITLHQEPCIDMSSPRLVTDRWIVLSEREDWGIVSNLLLELPTTLRHSLAFRTYSLPVWEDSVIPMYGYKLGLDTLYPLDGTEIIERIKANDFPYWTSSIMTTVDELIGLVSIASRDFSLIKLRGSSLNSQTLMDEAQRILSEARELLSNITDAQVNVKCLELIEQVECELDSPEQGFAADLIQAVRDGSESTALHAFNSLRSLAAESGEVNFVGNAQGD